MYRDNALIDSIVQRIVVEDEPVVSSKPKGALSYEHRVWAVRSPDEVAAIAHAFESVDSMYIADGHHRTAAACKFAEQQMRSKRRMSQHSK